MIPFKVVSSFFKAAPDTLEITLYLKSTYQERHATDVTVCIPIPPESLEQTSKSKTTWAYVPEEEQIVWR